MSKNFAVKDRDGTIHQEGNRKNAFRDQKAYGGLIVSSKDGTAWKPYKRKRVFLWLFLAVQAIFIILLIVAITTAHNTVSPQSAEVLNQCGNNGWQGLYKSYQDCLTSYSRTLSNAGNAGHGNRGRPHRYHLGGRGRPARRDLRHLPPSAPLSLDPPVECRARRVSALASTTCFRACFPCR